MKTITLISGAGDHINEFTKRLVEHWEHMAPKMQEEFVVSGEFNGVTLTATGKETPEILREQFYIQLGKNSEAYKRSPEYKKEQERRQKEVSTLQKKHDELISCFPTLNFKDYNAVIDFIHQYYQVTDHVGVEKNHKHVIKLLEDNGYISNANTGDNFKENDEENTARYIIGQFMSCVKESGACPPVLSSFYEKYVDKFRKVTS